MGDPGGEAIFFPAAKSDASLSDLAMTSSKSSLKGIRDSGNGESRFEPNKDKIPLEDGIPSTLAVMIWERRPWLW